MQEKITIQYLIGAGLALLIIPIVEGALAVLPYIGWHFLQLCILRYLLCKSPFTT